MMRNFFTLMLTCSLLFVSQFAKATTLTVTATTENVLGAFRLTVEAANSGDTILFSPLIDGIPINLSFGEITITKDLTIIGNGNGNTILNGSIVPG